MTPVRPELLLAIAAMAAVTFALRAAPLLIPGRWMRPEGRVADFLQLMTPGLLASLALVAVLTGSDAAGGPPALAIRSDLVAIVAGLAIVARTRQPVVGLAVAVAIAIGLRAIGLP